MARRERGTGRDMTNQRIDHIETLDQLGELILRISRPAVRSRFVRFDAFHSQPLRVLNP